MWFFLIDYIFSSFVYHRAFGIIQSCYNNIFCVIISLDETKGLSLLLFVYSSFYCIFQLLEDVFSLAFNVASNNWSLWVDSVYILPIDAFSIRAPVFTWDSFINEAVALCEECDSKFEPEYIIWCSPFISS